MNTLKYLIVLPTCAALIGCTETAPERAPLPANIMELPEAQARSRCLREGASDLAKTQGNAIDLGFLVAGRCKPERYDFLVRVSNGNVRVAQSLEAETAVTDMQLAAEMIIARRGY